MVNASIENLNNRRIDVNYTFENQKRGTLAVDLKT
jgi:hypothetical protein